MFDRDSTETKFVESTPLGGHVAAVVHHVQGNKNHAKRAVGKANTATLTTAGGALGGPMGAGAGNLAGQMQERKINDNLPRSTQSSNGTTRDFQNNPVRETIVTVGTSGLSGVKGLAVSGAAPPLVEGVPDLVAGKRNK